MKKFTYFMAVAATAALFAGCSFSAPKTQIVSVTAKPKGAEILVNGTVVGSGSQIDLSRGGDFNIHVSKDGYYSANQNVSKTLSKVGILDVVGGCFFLVPFVGLVDDGAWEFTRENIIIELQPEK